MSTQADIQQQAAEWLVRRDQADLSQGERARFEAWLAADSRHRAVYLELEQTWRESDGLRAWRPHDGTVDPAILRSRINVVRSERSTRRWPFALAASFALTAIAVVVWLSSASRPATYVTDVGGYERVLLRDGSVVQLNTDTQVRIELAEHRREARLIRGEAFFEVAHDSDRPFEVIAGGTVVRAVGTAFTVRLRSANDVEVVVTEGRVALSADESTPDETAQAAASPTLAAGEAAVARPTGVVVRQIPQPEVTRKLAWQNGELDFKGESLLQVVSEFNRYNHTRLEIADPRLAALEVGGNFRATDVEGFVRALQSSFPIRAAESEGVIRLEMRE